MVHGEIGEVKYMVDLKIRGYGRDRRRGVEKNEKYKTTVTGESRKREAYREISEVKGRNATGQMERRIHFLRRN